MTDKSILTQMLGITAPWAIARVQFDLGKNLLEVFVECSQKHWVGEDGRRLAIHGHTTRRWRHLNAFQFETYIVAKVPRVKYPKQTPDNEADGPAEGAQADSSEEGSEDGLTEHAPSGGKPKTVSVAVPWADTHSRVTRALECFVVQVLQACNNVSAAAGLLGMSWDEVDRIMDRAVKRGLDRRPEREVTVLGIDEKGFGKSQDFATILTDHGRRCVHDLTPGRKAEDAQRVIEASLTEAQRDGVKAITMDMSRAYILAAKTCLPLAAILFDRFHIAMLLNKAVDTTRKAEHAKNTLVGDDSLKKTKYLWLEGVEDMTDERRERLEQAYKANALLARTWMDKENFNSVFESSNREEAMTAFVKWEKTVLRRRGLEPMKKVAATLRRHLDGILAYIEHRATNALAEGINSLISVLKGAARGLRNFARFRVRVLFYHGKLDLLPAK